jgi:hypothetical protein
MRHVGLRIWCGESPSHERLRRTVFDYHGKDEVRRRRPIWYLNSPRESVNDKVAYHAHRGPLTSSSAPRSLR